MTSYRPYRNTDPPALADVWNEAVAGRGAYPVRTPGLLERWLFSKLYFDPAGLIVAERPAADGGKPRVVGFALAGFGPDDEQNALDPNSGVVCCVVVRPEVRRQGIGRELLRRAEAYLADRGKSAFRFGPQYATPPVGDPPPAAPVRFGPQFPRNPFLLGLYGGSNSPGVLDSNPEAAGFLAANGYQPADAVTVFQRKLDTPLVVADPRFTMLRRRYDVQLLKTALVGTWWHECQVAAIEPAEFRVMDKLTNLPAARAVAWELEGFSWKWGSPSAGIVDIQVRPDLRRQGVAKMLLVHILRFLQDQFFGIGELQVKADDPVGVGLCLSVGFEPADTGRVYVKSV